MSATPLKTLDLDDAAKAQVRSMTGYGRIEREVALGESIRGWACVESRSVNSRYLDVRLKLPRQWSVLEPRVMEIVQSLCTRGKLDINLIVEKVSGAPGGVAFDVEMARAYVDGARKLAGELGIEPDIELDDVLSLPNVVIQREDKSAYDLELAWKSMKGLFEEAIGHMWNMRAQEGSRLVIDMRNRCVLIADSVTAIESDLPDELSEYKKRLTDRIQKLTDGKTPLDDARLATELAYYAERSDITEELVRLKSHLAAFDTLLNEGGTVGKKLDFLLQEMGREANTIGSKALSTTTGKHGIAIKAEIEKLREQAQNIE